MSAMHDTPMLHARARIPAGQADSDTHRDSPHRRILETGRCATPSDFLRLLYPDGVPHGRRIILWRKGAEVQERLFAQHGGASGPLRRRQGHLRTCLPRFA